MEPRDRGWLEQLADQARDVMDLVMTSERVWGVFQEEEWLLVVNSPALQFRVLIDAGHNCSSDDKISAIRIFNYSLFHRVLQYSVLASFVPLDVSYNHTNRVTSQP